MSESKFKTELDKAAREYAKENQSYHDSDGVPVEGVFNDSAYWTLKQSVVKDLVEALDDYVCSDTTNDPIRKYGLNALEAYLEAIKEPGESE